MASETQRRSIWMILFQVHRFLTTDTPLSGHVSLNEQLCDEIILSNLCYWNDLIPTNPASLISSDDVEPGDYKG